MVSMSVSESTITNPKKQLEFYKNLSEQLHQEKEQLKSQLQQRDEVIKEAIKRTSEIKELGFDRIAKIEILDILNKYKND